MCFLYLAQSRLTSAHVSPRGYNPLASFNAATIDLWWSAKAKRPSQKERKVYRQRSTSRQEDDTSDHEDSEVETKLWKPN